jgi:hypothetical protein
MRGQRHLPTWELQIWQQPSFCMGALCSSALRAARKIIPLYRMRVISALCWVLAEAILPCSHGQYIPSCLPYFVLFTKELLLQVMHLVGLVSFCVVAADLHGVNNLLFDGLVEHNFILHDFHCGSRQYATLVVHRKE